MFLLVPACPGSPGQRAVKRSIVCVCVCVCVSFASFSLSSAKTSPLLQGAFAAPVNPHYRDELTPSLAAVYRRACFAL